MRPIIIGAAIGALASIAIGAPDRPDLPTRIAALRAAGCTTDSHCAETAWRMGLDPLLIETPRGELAFLCDEAVDDACTYLAAFDAADRRK